MKFPFNHSSKIHKNNIVRSLLSCILKDSIIDYDFDTPRDVHKTLLDLCVHVPEKKEVNNFYRPMKFHICPKDYKRNEFFKRFKTTKKNMKFHIHPKDGVIFSLPNMNSTQTL